MDNIFSSEHDWPRPRVLSVQWQENVRFFRKRILNFFYKNKNLSSLVSKNWFFFEKKFFRPIKTDVLGESVLLRCQFFRVCQKITFFGVEKECVSILITNQP